MKLTMRRKIGMCLMVFSGLMLLTGCETNWVTTAIGIVQALGPVITGIIGFILTFTSKLPADLVDLINKWKAEAVADLAKLKDYLEQYNAAAADDTAGKTRILEQIQDVVLVLKQNANAILDEIHVMNAALRSKVEAVIDLVLSELASILAMIPAFKVLNEHGAQAAHQFMEVNSIVTPLSPKKLLENYNRIMKIPTGDAEVDKAAKAHLAHV